MPPSPRVLAVRLNLPDVDDQFPAYFKLLDELHAAFSRHLDEDEIRPLLKSIVIRTVLIFRREEEAMELTRDRMALAHRTAHQRFLKVLQSYQSTFEDSGVSIAMSQDFRRDVIDWMSEHHLLMDAALGRHVQEVVERSLDRISRADGAT
ncbi:MAG: hypothetical protein H6686_06190 [Fibrobacteria bacterium]|nr:hypothetical protein [Fibrobacteria bacterium]